jgi:diguanylate cyclase (GGDEF)-like protein
MRMAVEGASVEPVDDDALTASIGIASSADGVASAQDLVARADSRLYRAKSAGRNRVCSEDS